MSGSGSGDDEPDAAGPAPTRFADLIGDAKPLDPGPRRADRPTPRVRPGARVPSESKSPRGPRFRRPDPADPFTAGAEGVNDLQLAALARGEPEPEERIDLHGTRRRAAERLLAKRLASARTRGLASVVVIHGQGRRSASGEAVLRDALPGWLTRGETAQHVLGFCPAPDRLGGLGATLVLLRRSARTRS